MTLFGVRLWTESVRQPDPIAGAAVRELFAELGILLARGTAAMAREKEAERILLRLPPRCSFPPAPQEAPLEPSVRAPAPLPRTAPAAPVRTRVGGAAVARCPRTGTCGTGRFAPELCLRGGRAGLPTAEIPGEVRELRQARSTFITRVPRTLRGLCKLRWALWKESRAR